MEMRGTGTLQLLAAFAIGMAGCSPSPAGTKRSDPADAASAIGTRYIAALADHEAIQRVDVEFWEMFEFDDGELIVEVFDDRAIGRFQGLANLSDQRSAGFTVPLYQSSESDDVVLSGNRYSDNGRLTARTTDGELRGTIEGSLFKTLYTVDFVAEEAEWIDGTYGCRGYRCTDRCDGDGACDSTEYCAAATEAFPRRCVSDESADAAIQFIVLVSSGHVCQQEFVDRLPSPGVDIRALRVRDIDDGVVGVAQTIGSQPGSLPNAFSFTGFFPGAPRAVDISHYALGCGHAYLAVQFVDDSGTPLELDDSFALEIDVAQPDGANSFPTLDAYGCTGMPSGNAPLDSCTILLGHDIGESTTIQL